MKIVEKRATQAMRVTFSLGELSHDGRDEKYCGRVAGPRALLGKCSEKCCEKCSGKCCGKSVVKTPTNFIYFSAVKSPDFLSRAIREFLSLIQKCMSKHNVKGSPGVFVTAIMCKLAMGPCKPASFRHDHLASFSLILITIHLFPFILIGSHQC